AAALQNAAEGEDITHVIVNDQNLLSNQGVVRAMQAIKHDLFLGRKVRDDAVEEESGLVEEALRRFHSFDNHATRQGVQAGVFFGREVFAGENDHGQIVERRGVAD